MKIEDSGGVELVMRAQKRLSRKAGVIEIVEAASGFISDIILSSE